MTTSPLSHRAGGRRLARKAPWAAATAIAISCGFALPAAAAAGRPVVHPRAATAAHSTPSLALHPGGAVSAPAPSRAERAAEAVLRDQTQASLLAQRTHKGVVVTAATDTGTLLTANPNGSFTLTQTSEPVRVSQHGVWVPVNPDLVRGSHGMLQPRATATGIAFSAGGSGPMVTMTSGSDRLSFTFPYALPRPAVNGPDATYRNVLPGVDLELTANASGFSEMLIVRTRAAAASSALHALHLRIRSAGVTLSDSADGGAQAVSKAGATVFHTDTAAMWDSAGTPMTTARTPPAPSAAASAASGPSEASHIARVGVRISATTETLIPNSTLLSSPRTALPIYIDPAWSGNPSQLKWARISSNGWNIYNSTSTASSDHPRSGFDDWPGGASEVARTYYQMDTGGSTGTTGFLGAHVTSSTLSVVNNWSADSASTNCEIYLTNGISTWNSTGLNWSRKPAEKTYQDDAGSYESGSTVHPGTLTFTVTNAAQAAVSGNWGNITYELRSNSETSNLYWKQYASGGGPRCPRPTGATRTSSTTK